MEELLASMHDLTGSHVLPILAAHVHASPQPAPRQQHGSAAGTSVSEQLAALKALQQEGAQAFSDKQACHTLPRMLLLSDNVFNRTAPLFLWCIPAQLLA